MAGVIVAGVRDSRIAWGRLYVEPVETRLSRRISILPYARWRAIPKPSAHELA